MLKRIAIWTVIIGALTYLAVGLTMAADASATAPTYPYDVTVAWQMPNLPADTPLNTPQSGPYTWPQSRLAAIPVAACGAAVPVQVDTYTIKDSSDADYLAGLTTLNSSADDARLSPHDYYAELIGKPASACTTTTTTTPTPTPTPSTSTVTSSSPPPSSSSSKPPTSHASTPPSSSHSTTTHSSTPSHSVDTPTSITRSNTSSSSTPVRPSTTTSSTPVHPLRRLANTGPPTGMLFGIGTALVVGGCGMLALSYRRPRRH